MQEEIGERLAAAINTGLTEEFELESESIEVQTGPNGEFHLVSPSPIPKGSFKDPEHEPDEIELSIREHIRKLALTKPKGPTRAEVIAGKVAKQKKRTPEQQAALTARRKSAKAAKRARAVQSFKAQHGRTTRQKRNG